MLDELEKFATYYVRKTLQKQQHSTFESSPSADLIRSPRLQLRQRTMGKLRLTQGHCRPHDPTFPPTAPVRSWKLRLRQWSFGFDQYAGL